MSEKNTIYLLFNVCFCLPLQILPEHLILPCETIDDDLVLLPPWQLRDIQRLHRLFCVPQRRQRLRVGRLPRRSEKEKLIVNRDFRVPEKNQVLPTLLCARDEFMSGPWCVH